MSQLMDVGVIIWLMLSKPICGADSKNRFEIAYDVVTSKLVDHAYEEAAQEDAQARWTMTAAVAS